MKRSSHSVRGTWRLFGRFSRGFRLLFAAALAATMLYTAFNAVTPQIIRITVDSVLDTRPFDLPAAALRWAEAVGGRAFFREHLYVMALLVLASALCAGVFTFLARVCAAQAAEGFLQRLRNALFSHIQRLPLSWHVAHQTGDLIQRCTSDVEVVRGVVTNQLLEVFRTGFLVLFALSIMCSMNLKLSLAAMAFIPVIIIYSWLYYGMISRRFAAADAAEGELAAAVQENLTGVRVVRAFGREAFEIERFDRKNDHYTNLWLRLGYLLGSYWGLGDLITGLQIITVIVLGTVEAVAGQITTGEFIAFVSYNATLIWPIRGLGRILSEMSKSGVSIERINHILQAQEEQDDPDGLTPPMDGDLVFEHVTFGYQPGAPVLRDVSFTIPGGSTFAILAGTGEGKSTLVQLLCRLYELPEGGGRITAGGVDLANIRLSWLRSQIGIVLQEPFLFSRTIRENIAAARPDAGEEEIRYAARIACVDEAIGQFADGYETVVGERGVTLSGGQKQRVAMARTLLKKAPILILDDSLSAVDSETDARIRTALRENLSGSTVILISHRITTLMHADCILVLQDGAIAEMGTHEELIRREGIYRTIYEIQMRSDDRDAALRHPNPAQQEEQADGCTGRTGV